MPREIERSSSLYSDAGAFSGSVGAAWVAASRDLRSADKAITVALKGWDEAAGLDDEEVDLSASAMT